MAVGKSFHRIPVLMTNRIPSSAARLSTLRRPGNRYRRCGTGTKGSNRDHNSSVTTRSTTTSSLRPTSQAPSHTTSAHSELTSKRVDGLAGVWEIDLRAGAFSGRRWHYWAETTQRNARR